MPARRDQLFDALWAVADGPGATVKSIQEHSALMRLRYVVAAAMPGVAMAPRPLDVAITCRERIRQAAASIGTPASKLHPDEPNTADAAAALLGVLPGTKGLLAKDRRRPAADFMRMKVATLRKRRHGVESHERRLVREVAVAMDTRETDFVKKTGYEMTTVKTPQATALSDNWLLRYEQYYRIWTQVDALRADIAAVLGAARAGEAGVEAEYSLYALYDYARFQYELERFIQDYGGKWIFAEADVGEAIASSVYLIRQVVSELSHRDDSILRLLSCDDELHSFLRRIEQEPSGTQLIEAWRRWLSYCGCDLAHPIESGCNVHRLLAACETYVELIDADWYLLADWYREPPKYRTVIDPADLFYRLKLIAEADAAERSPE